MGRHLFLFILFINVTSYTFAWKNYSDDPNDTSYIVDLKEVKAHRKNFLEKYQSGAIPYEKNKVYICTNCGFAMHANPKRCIYCLDDHFFIEDIPDKEDH